MSIELRVFEDPPAALLRKVAELDPANPFCTLGYVNVLESRGHTAYAFLLYDRQRLAGGCVGGMRHGRFTRSLAIASLASVPAGHTFWEGLRSFCLNKRVILLTVDTKLALNEVDVPQIGNEKNRTRRNEYTLELKQDTDADKLSSNHKRNIRKAQNSGITVHVSTSIEACRTHCGLMIESGRRRRRRGETMPTAPEPKEFFPYLEQGMGEFFQAKLNDEVVSSAFFLLAEKGAYYQSGGTSAKGMSHGAAQFLIYSAAQMLANRSFRLLHLAAAQQQADGLNRFKAGFGATKRECLLVRSIVVGRFLSGVTHIWRNLRKGTRVVITSFLHMERFIAY